jgi:tetratricopeptide (TPR) repeat protein
LTPSEIAERLRTLPASPASARREADLAFLCLAAQRGNDAERFAEAAFSADPDEPYAAYACAMTRVARQDWARALEALLKIPVDFERAGEVATLCGLALLELGRIEEADRICTQIGGVDDETYATLCGIRARVAAMQGKAGEAAELLDRAVRYAPTLEWARRMRSSLPAGEIASAIVTVVV